jgi:hypothetical protein
MLNFIVNFHHDWKPNAFKSLLFRPVVERCNSELSPEGTVVALCTLIPCSPDPFPTDAKGCNFNANTI